MTKPTEDELLDLYKIWAYTPNDAQDNPLTPYGNFCAGYEARAELADKEKAELQAQIEYVRSVLERLAKLGNGDRYGNSEGNCISIEALAKTAPQCLQEHDNEVIERCAKVADCDGEMIRYEYIANKIRALKG